MNPKQLERFSHRRLCKNKLKRSSQDFYGLTPVIIHQRAKLNNGSYAKIIRQQPSDKNPEDFLSFKDSKIQKARKSLKSLASVEQEEGPKTSKKPHFVELDKLQINFNRSSRKVLPAAMKTTVAKLSQDCGLKKSRSRSLARECERMFPFQLRSSITLPETCFKL